MKFLKLKKPEFNRLFVIRAFIILYFVILIIRQIYIGAKFGNTVLLFLASLGVVIVIDPFLKGILNYYNNKVRDKQRIIDHHKKIALKHNKKDYLFGKNKQHVIYARNHFEASKIWNNRVLPLTKKTSKTYYYISEACNNLSN